MHMHFPHRARQAVAALAIALFGTGWAGAQAQPAPSAPSAQAPSAPVLDPALFMRGHPPPPDYRIHIGNWQRWPQKIWSFQHTRELFPTRGLEPQGPVWALPKAPVALDDLAVGTPGQARTWPQMLTDTHTDAVLVLHRGRIVDERYLNGMQPQTPHLMFSATKSMAGLMGAVLVAEGRLDPNARVATVLPELADSAWADATVQQVLDMTDGVRFSEVYTDPTSDIFAYIGAMGWAPQYSNPTSPSGIRAMLPTLRRVHDEPRGSAFRYRSPATDVAAWLAARAAGQSLTEWLQQRLWGRLGMEFPANVMLDPAGTEVAFAGMSATLRDLGRLGQLLLQRGQARGEQLIPAAVVDDLARGGDVQAFAASGIAHRAGWSYRNQWWVYPGQPRRFAAMGAYGQRLYVFPDHELVVVILGSHPQPISALIDPSHDRAFEALIARLKTP